MIPKITLSFFLAFAILVSSCVSTKKYKAATTDAQNSKTANAELTKKNSDLQNQLNDAINSNKMVVEERDRLQKEADSAKSQLKTMQSALDEYNGGLDQVQKNVSDKMADYASRGVDVQNKDGMVYVSVEDSLLFKKGTNKVSRNGETVLSTLASSINDPNLKILVVGHTDDRAAKGGDSWSVSTERANNVVRSLKNMKIDPARLTSAGQGQYNAVADNSTAEGRAQNRRTQIILVPAAFKLLGNKQ